MAMLIYDGIWSFELIILGFNDVRGVNDGNDKCVDDDYDPDSGDD